MLAGKRLVAMLDSLRLPTLGTSTQHCSKYGAGVLEAVESVHGHGIHCAVLFDNLGAHNSIDLHCALRKKGMWPTRLLANTSTFLQPLDDAVFGAMK